MLKLIKKIFLFVLLCIGAACQEFLDEKPDKQLVVPATLKDLQALLDNYSIISDSDPAAAEISADDYYLGDNDWAGLSQEEHRRLYTWEKDRLFAPGSNDWFNAYRPVYTANTVLENIGKVTRTPSNQAQWDNVQGQAHFIRARAFLQVAGTWSPAYTAQTAATSLGIPLRLSTDFKARSTRPPLRETYVRILSDLQAAAALLPETQVHPVRPSRAAAYALLARTYLYMHQYPDVEANADSALRISSALLDFNSLNPAASFPVTPGNREIISRSIIRVPAPLNVSRARVVPALYQAYAADDLRKSVFFKKNSDGSIGFKGSYEGSANLFSGITTGEVYLMRAEARARQGNAEGAMEDLNTLLASRWKTGTFVPLAAGTPPEALALVLLERRKELLMRGLRWMDLKRLNSEGAGITLTRTLNGQTYSLPPNDPRYALPLPEDVIELSGMQQNPR